MSLEFLAHPTWWQAVLWVAGCIILVPGWVAIALSLITLQEHDD